MFEKLLNKPDAPTMLACAEVEELLDPGLETTLCPKAVIADLCRFCLSLLRCCFKS
jgi:hypothetical protein